MADAEKPYRRLQGRPHKGKVPTAPRPERAGRGSDGTARHNRAGRAGARRIGIAVARSGRPARRLDRRQLPLLPERRRGRERAPAEDRGSRTSRPRTVLLTSKPSLILLLGTDGDKTAARAGLPPLRLDPARAHRPEAAPDRRTSRSRATSASTSPGYGPNKINAAFQLGGPALTMKTVRAPDRPAAEPRRHRRLRRLQGGDRRTRRGRDRRAEADPLQPLRLPLCDRRTLPGVAGLALREGQAEDGRQARADLLARPREPARPGRQRPHARRAAAGGRRGDDEQARLRRDLRASCPSSATTSSSR